MSEAELRCVEAVVGPGARVDPGVVLGYMTDRPIESSPTVIGDKAGAGIDHAQRQIRLSTRRWPPQQDPGAIDIY